MTVNNLRIFDTNLALGSSVIVSVSNQVNTLPGTNLIQAPRKKAWRGTSTQATAVIDLGASTLDVNSFSLISSNLGTTGTVILQANASDSWESPTYSSGVMNPYDQSFTSILLWHFTLKTLRYWRIVLDDPSNSSGYVEAGMAWLGTYVNMERNFRYGWGMESLDLSRTEYADDGTPYTDDIGNYKALSLSIGNLTETFALNTLMPAMKTVSGRKDILLSLFPERAATEGTQAGQKLNFYGRILSPKIVNTSFGRYEFSANFRESN